MCIFVISPFQGLTKTLVKTQIIILYLKESSKNLKKKILIQN